MRGLGWRKRLTLVFVCLVQIMVLIDLSIVAVALPSIGRDLGFAPERLQWVIIGYALIYGGFLLLGGRAVDMFGQRRLVMAGLITFGLASLLGGLAVAPWMLIAARIVQGLGAAVLSPATLALITRRFDEGPQRDRALGFYAAMAALGFTLGTVSGGLLTELLSWRWVLFVNVPVVLLALALIPLLHLSDQIEQSAGRLDLPGAITVTAGLATLIYALSEANNYGWLSLTTIGLILLGAGLLLVFLWIERRAAAPLVPLAFFRQRSVTVANAAIMLKSTVGVADILIPTLYFQQVLMYSPLQSGLSFIPMGLTAILAGWAAGRLVSKIGGVKPVMLLGLAVEAVGLLLMTQMPERGWWPLLLVGMLIEVTGYLTADVALTLAANSGLQDDQRGLGAGMLNTSQQLGAAWGTGVITSVIAWRSHAPDGANAEPSALIAGFQSGLLVGVGFAVIAFLLVLVALPSPAATPSRAPQRRLLEKQSRR